MGLKPLSDVSGSGGGSEASWERLSGSENEDTDDSSHDVSRDSYEFFIFFLRFQDLHFQFLSSQSNPSLH